MANPWFRVWSDMVNDPKWRTIARISKQKVGDVISVYVHMMTMASNATERGRTEGFNDEDVATALDIETEQVTAIREAMQGRVLDGDQLTGWEKRQPAREDGSADRAKAFRERKKAESELAQTQANAIDRQIREEEIRQEQSKVKNNDNTVVVASPAEPELPAEPASPTVAAMPPREVPEPSNDPAIVLTVALRKLGVNALFTHPTVQDWTTRNVPMTVLMQAVAMAREQKGDGAIPPNYLAPIVDKLLNPGAARPVGRSSPTLQTLKFNPNDQDRSGDALAMAEGMRRNGIAMPAPNEEIDI